MSRNFVCSGTYLSLRFLGFFLERSTISSWFYRTSPRASEEGRRAPCAELVPVPSDLASNAAALCGEGNKAAALETTSDHTRSTF